ncbi:MAG: hypothetical protein ACMUEL_06745 [Flavobacteriales bacterium Tduv]
MFYFHSRGIKYVYRKKLIRTRPLSSIAILFNKLVSKTDGE